MPTISDPSSTSAERRLKALGIELPPPPEPFGTYVEAVQVGNLLYLSGMLPTAGHGAKFVGRVGAELDVNSGREAARLASLNALAVARQHLGSLDKVSRVVKLNVSVATSGDVREQPKVADAASELLRDVFGEERNPARSVYGVASLPLGAPVELEIIFEVAGKEQRGESPVQYPTSYRTTQIDGHSIFYREAGPSDAPALLLLHGLPSSSRMFEPLFARLSDRYHLIAPDYPGFGHSDWPNPKEFAYTFDHYAEIINHFTESLGLSRFTLYMQDYGGPVGFRMALKHPERIEALIVQDAVAHNEGLGANWKTRRAFWADRAANESALRANLLSLATTQTRHVGDDPNVERYDPDLWTDEFAFLNSPGQADIQSDLFYDYRTNVESYPSWQRWMREKQPRLLVIWGKYDKSFELSEPDAYRRDVPDAEVHLLDAGHFALDTAADQIAELVGDFMS
ncbi:MAG TPA: alpha/beta fold hydrolase [Gemmatimonadaceae bacterium]|nr:alpha/beta fold hydrolase [Gemmatimonadaceae bacterium]